MMKEKKLVPRRRFKGFENRWENITVKDIGNSFYGGGTPRTSVDKYWNGNIPWIQSSDLVEDLVYLKKPRRTITQLGLTNSATKLVPSNSISIVTRVGVGKLAFVSYEFSTSQDFLSISDLNVDYNFGTYVLYKLLKKEKEFVQGTSIKGLTKSELLSMFLNVASKKEEQQKIGEFFVVLDERIANQERKIAKVKALKSAYLTEMFPQEGETVPRRRFKGFEGEWREKRLDEIAQISAGGDVNRLNLSDIGAYPVIANTLNKSGIIGYYKNQYQIKAPAVTVTGRGDVGHATARLGNFTPVVRLLVIKSDLNVHFLENIINNLQVIVESTGVPQLTSPQLGRYIIKFPTIKEQQKIGAFFKNLDDQITTEETKLEKLKKTKEAYLEEMFV